MRRLLLALLLVCLGRGLAAGVIGSKLGGYASAGAGVGALIGAAAATVPYLQSHNAYDYYTGAGAGMLAGAGLGFLLGVLDVATNDNGGSQASLGRLDGLALAWQPGGMAASYRFIF